MHDTLSAAVVLLISQLAIQGLSQLNPKCPSPCTCYQHFGSPGIDVSCTSQMLRDIPPDLPAHTNRLDLSGNRISALHAGAFGSIGREVSEILLDRNRLKYVGQAAFVGCSTLRKISLAKNLLTSASFEPNWIWDGHYLQELDLSGNMLGEVDAVLLKNMTNLVRLHLSGNELSHIQRDSFSFSDKLMVLELFDNRLTDIPVQELSNLTKLSTLHIQKNAITEIPDLAFQHQQKLVVLEIQQNKINKLSADCLRGLENLKFLFLHKNRIKMMGRATFANTPNLRTVDLSSNLLTEISPFTFHGLNSLYRIIINDMTDLVSITSKAFVDLPQVKYLSVRGNKHLAHIAEDALMNVSISTYLYLDSNALSSLPANLTTWYSINRIRLHSNPWHCDCSIKWLRDFLQDYGHPELSLPQPTCASPALLQGRRVVYLSTAELQCPVSTRTTMSTIPSSQDTTDHQPIIIIICVVLGALVLGTVTLFALVIACRKTKWMANLNISDENNDSFISEDDDMDKIVSLKSISSTVPM